MKNRELHGYNDIPVSDTHIHIVFPKHPDETVQILRNFDAHFEYDSIAMQCLTRGSGHRPCDPSNSLKGLYVREMLNRERPNFAYVYGNVFHHLDEKDTPESYLEQAKTLYALGVDGYKFLDGKPSLRRTLGRPLCDPIYDKMYAFIEEQGMPVKLHLADPAYFWGPKENLSEWAIKRGWWCGDGTYPTRDEFYEETYGILKKFPKLKLTLAHFGFMTYDEAVAFLENWENTAFDLTPGAEWCKVVTENYEKWKLFFTKCADRIYFGTDTYNEISSDADEETYEKSGARYNTVRKMLENDPSETFNTGGILGDFKPLGLERDILEKIYYKNMRSTYGNPKPLNKSLFIECAEKLKDEYARGVYSVMPDDEVKEEIDHLDTMMAKI